MSKLPSFLEAPAAAATFIPRRAKFFRDNRLVTMKNVRKLNDNIYMLDYANDYALDALLEKGCASLGDLLKYAAKEMLSGVNLFKLGDSDFGCTTFNAKTPEAEHILGRNFDFRDASCFVVWTHPENGYKSISMVDSNFMTYGTKLNKPDFTFKRFQTLLAPYCPVDGLNEKGLAIAVLELKTTPTNQNTGKTDISTTVAIRGVLDKCATVDEALEFFKKYDMHDLLGACYHFHIADKSGKSAIIEYVNNDMRIFYREKNEGKDDCLYCANYFLSEDGDNEKGFGFDRIEKVTDKLEKADGVLSEEDAMALLDDVHLDYRHEKYPWQITTLWSSVYNTESLNMSICAGMDYSKIFKFSVDEPYALK